MRGQVCKRVRQRLRALRIEGLAAYVAYLGGHPAEWRVLDGLCRVTVSRFYRDREVFDALSRRHLPALLASCAGSPLRMWSVGCASGEEPYSLAMIAGIRLRRRFPSQEVSIVGTDVDAHLLERAQRACYRESSLRELPRDLLEQGFRRIGAERCLRAEYRHGVEFLLQDVRRDAPPGRFGLVLCRNLAFTYYAEDRQRLVLPRLTERLEPGGLLVIGRGERLPPGDHGLEPLSGETGIFRSVRSIPR